MAKCAVVGCESDGFEPPLPLKQWRGEFEFVTNVIVCGVHRGELSAPGADWRLASSLDLTRHEVYVGASSRQLNEFVVLEPPTSATTYTLGGTRELNEIHEEGILVPFVVRQRGKDNPETLRLLMSREMVRGFVGEMKALADDLVD